MPAAPTPGWVRRIAGLCAERPGLTAVVVAASFSTIALVALGPVLTRTAVNDAVAGDLGRLPWLAAGLVAIALLDLVGNFVRRDVAGRLSLWVQHTLRERVFESIQRLDGPGQDTLRTGQVVSRTNSDLQQLHMMLQMSPVPLSVLTYYVVGLAVMLWMSPSLTVVVVVVIALLGVTAWRTRRRVFATSAAASDELAGLTEHVRGVLAQAVLVKSCVAEAREVRWLDRESRTLFRLRVAATLAQAAPGATMLALPVLGQVALLCYGGWSVSTGRTDLGTFVAFAGFLAMLTGPTRVLASFLVIAQRTRASAERVLALVDARPEMRDGTLDVPPGPAGLELDDVHFGYDPEAPVLRGVSFDVAAGETVAVVGASGSGKSTLSLLVPRFYDPTSGQVRIGAPGARRDVTECRLEDLRREVGVVFEDPFLFAGTVADNIAYGHPDASRAEVEAAAEAAGAAGFVTALPQGYDAVLGERGRTLSGGQRQRLALARALLGAPRLLVLDDATSAVDPTTEADINTALRRYTATGRMLLVIARRRSTLDLADRIVVLERGRVVDTGTREELEERCAAFRSLLAGSDGSLEEVETGDLWPEEPAAPAPAEGPASRLLELPAPAAEAALHGEQRRLRGMVGTVRGLFAAALALIALDTAAGVGVTLLVQRGIDHGVVPGEGRTVALAAAVALALVAVAWCCYAAQTVLAARASESVQHVVRLRSFGHIVRLPPSYHERHADTLLTRMTVDVDALARFLQNGLVAGVVSIVTMVGISVAMIVLDLRLALVALAGLPVVLVASIIYRRLSSPAYAQARTEIGKVNSSLQEKVAGLRVVQAHGRQRDEAARFSRLSDQHRATRTRAQRYLALYFPFLTFCAEASYAVVLLVGARQVAAGDVTPGVLAAFLLFLGQFYGPIQQLSGIVDGYQQATASGRRIEELLATPGVEPAPAPDPDLRLEGDLVATGLSYRYDGADTDALAGLDVRIPAGTVAAVVGESGAGKSTLVKLLAGLYRPDAGRLDLGATELTALPLADHRAHVGLVSQDVTLVDGDVAANIRYARPASTDAEVQAAAAAVGALPVVRALPRGFRTPVDRGGAGLSAGERQLLALARTQLADTDLLVLDEATARLDGRAETAVLDAVTAGRRTAVVVAHRLSTAARCDLVLVLADGRLVEQGTHDELLAADGAYARLWRDSAGTPSPALAQR